MNRLDSGSWASNYIDNFERGSHPVLTSGLISDIKAKIFQGPAAISSGALRLCDEI